jgi:hypothetical protein
MHTTLIVLPRRARLRSAKAEPRFAKSKTASIDPNLPVPTIARALFKREKDRSDSELPSCKKSSTESELPRRAKLRKLSDEPRCRKSRMLVDDPSREKPRSDRELPM